MMTVKQLLGMTNAQPGANGTGDGNPEGNQNNEPDKNQQTDPNGGDNGESKKTVEFTPEQQAKLNEIVQQRLADEKKKREKAEEEARLQEEGKYKDLLEKREKELEEMRNEIKTAKIDSLKTEALSDAGYAKEQIAFAKRNLSGETEEEINASLEELKAVFPPQSDEIGFPNNGNGSRKTPPQKDGYDEGREMARKVLERRKR